VSLAQALSAKSIDAAVALSWASEVATRVRAASTPERIILFGSAVDGRFKEGSDLDLLLIYADAAVLRSARSGIRQGGRLSVHCPVDLIFVTTQRFAAYCDLGGICYVAAHEGVDL
jgi:predicted nucleotidyltransferase